jgi:hypothetical protein
MEMQQMIERLLAGQVEIKAKADVDREQILAQMNAKIDVNQTKMDENQERMVINLKEMNATMDANQAEINAKIDRN